MVNRRRWTRRNAGPAPRTFTRAVLHARLEAALRAPITLVVADEGLGKSTLIRDYLHARGLTHLRFTATSDHGQPGELLRGLAATFSTVSPAMARSAGPAALQLERGDGEAVALAWAREHLAGVATTVVLDDLHHVVREPRCASFLVSLIDATVPHVRWIVSVREAAALPVPRWLAAGLCDLPIESGELRVGPDEISETFAHAGWKISDDEALALYEATGGWALGLRVAAASGHWEAKLSPDDVYDGLVDAALKRFTDEECDRVYEIAAAGRFDAELLAALECDAQLGVALCDAQLAHGLDDATHALYEPCRDRLQLRLDALPPARRSAILDRSASALTRIGRWHEALALRIRAGDEDGIAATLEERGFKALDQGEVVSVGRALAALSEGTLTRYSTALAVKAALASIDASFDVSEAWFTLAIGKARDDERREIVLRYGMDLVRRGRPDAIELLEAETAKVVRADADADAGLWALLGTAYVSEHRLDDAREAVRHALLRLPGVRDDALRARVLHQASYVALNDGDHANAKVLAERALARADEAFLYDLTARALSVLFNVAMLHDDDVAAARAALRRLEEAGRKAGSDGLRLYAILNAYSIEVDAGDVAAVEQLHAQLDEMQVLLTPMVSEGLLPAQALRAAWDGRFEHAYEMLEPGAEKLFDDDRIAYRWAEVAVYGAAAGKLDGARTAIVRSRESLGRISPEQPLAVRSAAYLALAETLLGDDAGAVRSIAAARAAVATRRGRMRTLIETVATFYQCSSGGMASVLLLGDLLEGLERCGLGGVARFIGRLPVETVEPRRFRSRPAEAAEAS
jgi:ATP/maltotriose-dependent transcriptional regulator MalT